MMMMMMTLASSTPSSRGEILISFTELQVGFDRIAIPSILSGEPIYVISLEMLYIPF